MDEPGDRDDIVSVSTKSIDALSDPTFIIHAGDKYYVTLSTWEYDLDRASPGEQREGVEQIKRYFAPAFEDRPLKAVMMDPKNTTIMCATCHPHRPFAIPTDPPGVKSPGPDPDSDKG